MYYLSIEFLIGRLLFDALINLRLLGTARAALASLDVDIDQLRKLEPDAALGNGGLGRLAACYMDSMAALAVPAYGYGIRYEHGLFMQEIRDGWQHELPERWLAQGNPWEFERIEAEYSIRFGGSVEYVASGGDGTARGLWYPAERVLAVAHDTPITGWRGRHVNTLRLWSARATTPVHLGAFNAGDVVRATAPRAQAEAISRVLYPSDATAAGQELRLRQEYFFTSASLQDIVRRHLEQHESLGSLPDYVAIQLNDTHPAIAVAELMRILVDEHDFSWSEAWRITQATLSYTNHTLLPEALESWPVSLLNRMLPRHMQIIYVINKLHLDGAVASGLTDAETLAAISLIQEGEDKRARMGHLAFVGSHRINGVSALHTDADAADRVPRPRPRGAGPHRQHDQRHQLPALAVRGQSDADRIAGRHARRGRARRSRPADRARAVRRRRQFRRSTMPPSSEPTRRCWRAASRTWPASRSIRRRCSTCRSSASTNTSGSFSTSWRPSRSIWRSGWSRSATGRRG